MAEVFNPDRAYRQLQRRLEGVRQDVGTRSLRTDETNSTLIATSIYNPDEMTERIEYVGNR